MKTTNQVQRNGATKPVKSQAKIQISSAPCEFKIVRLRECSVDSPKIELPVQVSDFWREHVVSAPWYKDDKECLCVFLLNTRHRLLGFELVSQGTLDTVLTHPREVFRLATVRNAAGIIIAHNHPSGDPTPSEADIKVTRDLIRASQYLKIELLDHVIIGDARREKSYTSLRELGFFYTNDSGPVPESRAATAPGKTAALNLSLPDLCKEAATTFEGFKKSASAAIALAMMNASHIKFCTQAFAGWEDFKSALFQDGNIELPRLLEDQFSREFSAWLTNLDRLVKQCERHETSAHDAGGLGCQIENAVNALKHVVEMQGNEIGDRNDNGSLACSFLVTERLAAAFDKAWKAYGDLQRAVGARELPTGSVIGEKVSS
jgi:DNA repair protein RadC